MLAAGAWAATAPVITGASPDPFDAGGQAFLLTITGTGFVSGSVAKLSETALNTTFVSTTQLRGEITPALRALAGRPAVTVANPDGAVSNAFPIHISPVILSVAPAAATAGSAAVPVTVTGLGLTAGDVLLWSAPGRQTVIFPTLVNSSKLTAVIPAELVGAAQSAGIQIVDAQRDLSSATSVAFDVLAVPTIASLTPNPVDAGGAYFQLTVNGSRLCPSLCSELGRHSHRHDIPQRHAAAGGNHSGTACTIRELSRDGRRPGCGYLQRDAVHRLAGAVQRRPGVGCRGWSGGQPYGHRRGLHAQRSAHL